MRASLISLAVMLSAASAEALETSVLLPAPTDDSAGARLLRDLAQRAPFPEGERAVAAAGERGRLFMRGEVLIPGASQTATDALRAVGLGVMEAELFQDGPVVRLVARIVADRAAPPLPLSNGPPRRCARAAERLGDASVRVAAEKLVPWILSVLRRMDAERGQFAADALDVVKWNVGLDVRGDVAEQIAGPVDLFVDSSGGVTSIRARARLVDGRRLQAALARLAGFAFVLGGEALKVRPATFEGAKGFSLSSPALGLHAAVAIENGQIAAVVSPQAIPSGWRSAAGVRDPEGVQKQWDVLDLVGDVHRCAHVAIDCGGACDALAALARSGGAVADAVEMIRAFGRARGSAAVVLRVDGASLTVWGAWAPEERLRGDGLPGPAPGDIIAREKRGDHAR